MTSSIDRRVVEMGFDNKQFENGVQTSVRSLDNLKRGLQLDGAARSLANLETAGRSFSLQGISDSVRNISNGFSALGVVGITVLANLANSAVQLGKKIFNAISVEPLKKGLQEYETQIGAIQTILANTSSKGTTLDQVNAALDELNRYSDKTIYNFTEMTKNIGTFTAAGVGLDTATAAIKGIANLAAVSGSTSQQASVAMYQLSQAMASGTVKLMDWNSVVSAGMGGQIFQDALKETARVHGVAIDDMITSEGSFRETLAKGWLTTDILTETLSKFTGDLTKQQLISMGYTEQQTAEILKLGQLANDAATKVKTFSQLKDTLSEAVQSGWAQSWRIIIGDFEEAKTLFTSISDVLGKMIGESADSRNKLLQGWKDLGGRTVLIDTIRNAFEGLMSILTPIKEAFSEIFPPMTSQRLYSLTMGIAVLVDKLRIGEETADKIKRIFKGVAAVFDIAFQAVSALAGGFLSLFGSVVPSTGSILDFLAGIGDYLVNLRDAIKTNDTFNTTIDKIGSFLTSARTSLTKFGIFVKETFDKVKDLLRDIFGNVDTTGIVNFSDKIKTRFEPLGKIVDIVGKAFTLLLKIVKKVAPVFGNLASIAGDAISGLIDALITGIDNTNFNNIFDTLNAGLLAALILGIKKFMDNGSGALDDVKDILGGVTGILDGVRGSLEAWQNQLKASTLLTIAIAIAILAASIVAISLVDSTKLTTSLAAMSAMFAELIGAMSLFSKIPGGNGIERVALSLLVMSIAVLLLSNAVSNLAKLESKELVRGLFGMAVIIGTLVAFSKALSSQSGPMIKGSASLIVFALALEILADVVKKLGDLDPARLTNGLIAVGVLLAEIALFMKATDFGGMGIKSSIGILIMAGAMLILAKAVEAFGNMDADKLMQGLIGVGAILAEVALFSAATGDSKRVISTAIGLTILGAALLIMAEAVKRMGDLSWDEIGRGLVTMAGALTIIIVALRLMPKNILFTSVGLLIVATSLVTLAEAMTMMGKMTWDEIARGLVALAGSMLILSLGMYAMQGALAGAAAMLVVSAALAIFAPTLQLLGSMSWEEIGRGLAALAGAFLVIGVAGLLLAPVVPALLGLAGAIFLLGLATLAIGAGVLAFSVGMAALAVSGAAGTAAIVVMITTILGLVPMIVKTLVEAILMFAKMIGEAAPILAETLKAILLALIDVIVSVIPPLVDAILLLVTTMLQALADKLPDIIQAGFDIIIALLEGVRDNIKEVVTVAIEIVTEFLDAVATKIPDVIDSGIELMISFIDGLADGIENHKSEVIDAVGRLASSIISGLKDGILAGVNVVAQAMADLAAAALQALKDGLGIKSPSKKTEEAGRYAGEGLVNGLLQYSSAVKNAGAELGTQTMNGLNSVVSRITDAVNNNFDLSPTIRPVIDMTDVISGGKQIDKLLGTKTLNLSTATSKLSSIASGMPASKDGTTQINQASQQSAVSFTQYNYSPSALSRIDIYRQTKNQLMMMKGLVENK